MDIASYGANPGMSALVQTSEAFLWAGREIRNEYAMLGLVSTAVDSGNTPTTSLRPGLVMGRITASGLLKEYNPASTDGSEVPYCVLGVGQSVLNASGTAANTNCHVLLKGILVASSILNLNAYIRRAFLNSGRYLFDDDLRGAYGMGGLMTRQVTKAADYTVTAADVGTLFITSTGAVNFTLPALAAGLGPFEFLCGVDANMVITSAAGNDIVTDGDLQASSITYSTSSHKIGARIQVCANAAGTAWLTRALSLNAQTIA